MPGPDTDGDEILDIWEIGHGLDPNNPDDGASDPDGDNLLNKDEFKIGTHPKLFNLTINT